MRVPLTEISIICSINVIHSSLCHHTQNEKVLIDQHPYLNWLGQPSRKLSVAVSIASFKLLLAASHPPLPWYSAGTVEPAGAGAGAGAGARESKIARSKRAPRATWWRATVARNCRLSSRTRIPFEETEFAEGPGGLEPACGIAFRARWTISTLLYGKTKTLPK